MENDVPEQRGAGGRPDWFLNWLREVFLPVSHDPLASQIEQFENAVDQIPNIDEAVKKSLTTTLSTEARIILQKEDDETKVQQLLKTQAPAIIDKPSPMPWNQLTESKAKIIARKYQATRFYD